MMAVLLGIAPAGTEWSCPVNAVSTPAWRLLSEPRQLRIHSVFSAAVNLRTGDRLVTCTSGGDCAPHGVDVSDAGLDRLRQFGRTGDSAVVHWRADEVGAEDGVHALGNGVPVIYDPTVPEISLEVARIGALELLGRLAGTRPATGFGDVWPTLVADPSLIAAVSSVRHGLVDDVVIACLGRGPGLTPSGDDFLVGALAAVWSVGAADGARLDAMARPLEVLARRHTTDISVEYLHYACRGMAIGPLRVLLAAFADEDGAAVTDAVRRLRRFGHTSGMDCLLGVLVALIHSD